MRPYWNEEFGNAASVTHAAGRRAEQAVETAREQVARLVGADPREIVFTSGATEANNLAILGVSRARREGARSAGGPRVISVATEHRSVLDPCRALAKEGFGVTLLPVARDGLLDPERLRDALDDAAVLVSIMHANNEIGVVQPIAELAALARERGAAFHCDAAQSVGKIEADVGPLGVDLLSFTAHKLYGPKGVGALWVRRGGPRLEPILHGGGHERGLRSGTLPVPLVVGFGRACELAGELREAEAERLARLSERLWTRLSSELDGVELNGAPAPRLPGNLNASFRGVEGEALLAALPELALSTGSACTSALREPSHVLRALGADEERALSALRFGLGRSTGEADVDAAVELVVAQVARLRELAPGWRRAGRPARRRESGRNRRSDGERAR